MRAGELCGLRWEDVETDSCTVQVRQSAWGGSVGRPKTENATRRLPVSAELAQHLGRQRGRAGLLLVFHGTDGRPWNQGNVVRKHLKPLCCQLGIVPKVLHAFRHANATFLDQAHVPMKVRQSRLGHSDVSLTLNIYTHVIDEDNRAAAAKLNELLALSLPPAQHETVQ